LSHAEQYQTKPASVFWLELIEPLVFTYLVARRMFHIPISLGPGFYVQRSQGAYVCRGRFSNDKTRKRRASEADWYWLLSRVV